MMFWAMRTLFPARLDPLLLTSPRDGSVVLTGWARRARSWSASATWHFEAQRPAARVSEVRDPERTTVAVLTWTTMRQVVIRQGQITSLRQTRAGELQLA